MGAKITNSRAGADMARVAAVPQLDLSLGARALITRRIERELRTRKIAVPEKAQQKKELPPFHNWLEEVSPSFNWNWRHGLYLQQKFEEWIAGKYRHIAFFLPPRHSKSETITVRGPAYLLERNPCDRIIVTAYGDQLARMFSRKTRNLLRGRVALSKEKDAQDEWETVAGGGMRAAGLRSGLTGRGANWIFVDDPIASRREAESQAFRDAIYNGYTDDVFTRLEPGGKICWIQTRWHYDDPAGRIERSETAHNWHFVSLPALAEEEDLLGRAVGEALCPERYDRDALLAIKATLPRTFISLYQQRPSPVEGSVLQLGWFKRYKTPPAQYVRIIQSWDTAMKGAEINDPWACLTIGEAKDGGFYLLDGLRENCGYPEGKRQIKLQYLKWRPDIVLIENKSSGEALIQEYKHEMVEEAPGKKLPIKGMDPEGDKAARASAESDTIEGGLVWLPEWAEWLPEFEDEIRSFPLGAYDHYVDALTQALKYLTGKRAQMKIGKLKVGTAQPPKDGYTEMETVKLPTQEEMARLQLGWTWKDVLKHRR